MSSTSKDRDTKRTVPKFSSFKPQAPEPTPASTSKPERRDGSPQRKDDAKPSHRHREHDRKRDSEVRRGYREDRRDERRRSPSRTAKPTAPVQAAPKTTTSNGVFYFDKRGDPLILRYGSNERGKVPTYYRFGAGKVLGTTGRLIIHHDGARDTFTIQDRYRPGRGSVFRDKSAIKDAAARWSKTKYIKPPPTPAALPAPSDDFIALEPSKKRKRGDEEPSVVRDYRSIFGKNESSDSDPDSDDDMSQSDDEAPEMTTTKKRSIELNRRVRAEPTDISSWLELINLQDDLFRENQGEKLAAAAHLRTEAETRGLAQLKVSLHEEALSHATEALEREALVNGMMREGARAWSPKTLAKRWDDVSEMYPGSFSLWRARLDHEFLKVAECTFEDIRDFIVKRLRQLRGKLSEACASEDASFDLSVLCGQLIYVFLRLTRFLQDAGFLELAVATWQATLEMTFCRPRSLPEKEEDVLTEFSDFWETEVPRIGEEEAKGWSYFAEDANGATQETRTKPKTLSAEIPQTKDMFKSWAAVEKQAMAASRMPAFTMDGDAQDDPFRVVMFSDIKDFLVWLPDEVLATARPRLLDAFLLFCGLPTAQLSDGLIDAFKDDPFVAARSEAFETSLSQAESGRTLEERKTPEFGHQGGRMAISLDVLFPADSWFRYLDKWERSQLESRVEQAWVLATLKHLVLKRGVAELAQYYLALGWANEPTGARKVAKNLLKVYTTDAGLYSAYALIESANNNVDMAEKVLTSATGLVMETTKSQFLWNTWAWICLDRGQTETALIRLCSSIDRTPKTPPSPAAILKARSHFASTRDYALSSQNLDICIHHAESLALLEYLTSPDSSNPTSSPSQGNLPAALSTITTLSTDLLSRNLPHPTTTTSSSNSQPASSTTTPPTAPTAQQPSSPTSSPSSPSPPPTPPSSNS